MLVILCDFKGKPVQDMVNYIVLRLRELMGEDESGFRNYFGMLETLAENRDLQPNLDEAEKMLTQVDVTKFASYGWGMRAGIEKGRHEGIEEGIEKGRHEGILLLLSLQLKQRFGELPDATLQRMMKLTTQHLELLATAMSGFAGPASLEHWLTEVERGKRLD